MDSLILVLSKPKPPFIFKTLRLVQFIYFNFKAFSSAIKQHNTIKLKMYKPVKYKFYGNLVCQN